jgi:cell pole-organizing protein PopZ
MSKSAKAQEPSMEEILASIRRIIADEGGAAPSPSAGAAKTAQAAPAPAPRPVSPPAAVAPAPTTPAAMAPAAKPATPAARAPAANPPAAASESAPPPRAAPAPDESDVLELDQPVAVTPAGFTAVRGPDVMFRESEREAQRRPAAASASPAPPGAPAPAPAPPRVPVMMDDDLLSPNAAAAASAAFGTLAHTILAENARTLEDLVREMMRPMLKEWLDENLPGLVERIVRAEIERVARGGR